LCGVVLSHNKEKSEIHKLVCLAKPKSHQVRSRDRLAAMGAASRELLNRSTTMLRSSFEGEATAYQNCLGLDNGGSCVRSTERGGHFKIFRGMRRFAKSVLITDH
jgi:hypothetical protein